MKLEEKWPESLVFQGDFTKETDLRITDIDLSCLIPENLQEAKFVLCLEQMKLEALGPKFKENHPIVKKALLTSTTEQFVRAIRGYRVRKDITVFWGCIKD